MRRVIVLVIAVGLCAAACSSKNGPPAASSGGVTRPSSTAKLSIVEPKSGATITTRTVVVQLSLTGGTITKAVSTNIRPNIGHGKPAPVPANLDYSFNPVISSIFAPSSLSAARATMAMLHRNKMRNGRRGFIW